MAYFLAKTDPDTYSIENLEHNHVTRWDGVRLSTMSVPDDFVA